MSTSAHLFKGLYFNISLELDSNHDSQPSLSVLKATLIRHRRQINILQSLPSVQLLKNISQNLKIRYSYLQFDFDKAISLNIDGELKTVSYSELKSNLQKSKEKKEKFSFYNSLKFFPNCGTEVLIDENKAEFIIEILQKLEIQNREDEILIISGEMIWSRFINSQELINIIIKAFKSPIYILIDYYAIWQSLVNKDYKPLKNINKKYLLPQLLKLTCEPSKESIEIQKEITRKLLLINNNNLFYLSDGPYYFEDSLVPEWLLITKKLKNPPKNNFIQISHDLSRGFPIEIGYYSQRRYGVPQMSVTFSAGIDQKCAKKVGDSVDVNEMIGSYSELEFSPYSFKSRDEIKVFDGQIVKKGDLILIDRKGKRELAPFQAKVDLAFLKWGILRLIKQSIIKPVKSPFRGYIEGFSSKEGYTIRASDISLVPFDFIKGKSVIGDLSTKLTRGVIYYCQTYTDFIRVYGETGWSQGKYFKEQLKAIIINSLSLADFDKVIQIANPNLNIGIIDIGKEKSEVEYLKNAIGNQVVLTSQGLIINNTDSLAKLNVLKADELKGKWVKALDLEGRLIYGKIISKSTNNSNTVLISSDQGYFECHLSNIIII